MLGCDGEEEQEGPGQSHLVYLHGELSQQRAADFISALLTLSGGEPIEAWLSTPGGEAADMFAVYDVMRAVRGRSPIHTVAVGHVMSSGVLLLAAGTKGERRIGRHCRVMVHQLRSGFEGSVGELSARVDECRNLQSAYISALASESSLSEEQVRELLRNPTDTYLDAHQAIRCGIADRLLEEF